MMVPYFIVQDVELTSKNFSNEDILKNDHNKKEAKKVEYMKKIPETTSRALNVLEKIARREGLTVDLPTPDKLTVATSGAWFTMLALRDHEDALIKIILVSSCIAAMLGIGLLWYFCCC